MFEFNRKSSKSSGGGSSSCNIGSMFGFNRNCNKNINANRYSLDAKVRPTSPTLTRRQRKNKRRGPREQENRDEAYFHYVEKPLQEYRERLEPMSSQYQVLDDVRERDNNEYRVLADTRGRTNSECRSISDLDNTRVSCLKKALRMPKNLQQGHSFINANATSELAYRRESFQSYELIRDTQITARLRKYVLHHSQLKELGYPIRCGNDRAIITYTPYDVATSKSQVQRALDANAREFVPRSPEVDSGTSTGSSENSDIEMESSDSERNSDMSESSGVSSSSEKSRRFSKSNSSSSHFMSKRPCTRCRKAFYVNSSTGEYLNEERCIYHWGKLQNVYGGGERRWTCCRGNAENAGCEIAVVHVWSGLLPGNNGPLEGYVRTLPAGIPNYNVCAYAVDCEMCYTKHGLEITRVTVVDIDGKVLLETFVKPDSDVLDYNTRFSGITPDNLRNVTTTLREVQEQLASFIFAETILIGHGLENDLRALRMIHENVIDTAVVFPHTYGLPYRYSLKVLAKKVLQRDIQGAAHDSSEDAKTAIDIMLRRLTMDSAK